MEDLLIPFLDGELTPEEARCVKEHLAGCQACARVLEEHRRLFGLLLELPEAPRARGGDRAVAARRVAGVRKAATRWVAAAAAVLLALTLLWFGYRTSVTEADGEPIPDLPVVEEIVSLYEVGGEDLVKDIEIVHAVFELSQEAMLPEDY
jgi:anti-sigma factor RsiW